MILIETREVPLIDRIATDGEMTGGRDRDANFPPGRVSSKFATDHSKRSTRSERDFELRIAERKFVLPLVPPSVSSLNKPRRIPVPGGRWFIEYVYQEKQLVITLRRRSSREENSGQLLLF